MTKLEAVKILYNVIDGDVESVELEQIIEASRYVAMNYPELIGTQPGRFGRLIDNVLERFGLEG